MRQGSGRLISVSAQAGWQIVFTVVKGTNADPDKHTPLWTLITLGALVAAGCVAALRWPQKWEHTLRATNA